MDQPRRGQVTLLSGTYRIPEVARPLLRAALRDHQIRGLPAYALFAHRDGGLLWSDSAAAPAGGTEHVNGGGGATWPPRPGLRR